MAGRIVMICANPATRLALALPNLGLDRATVHRSSSFRAKTDARPARHTGAAVRAKRPANLEGQRLSARRFSVLRPAQASPTDIATVAAHITDMPAPLTLHGAAELAATLAHTSALLEIDDAGYPAFATLTPHLTDKDRHRHWASMLDAANRQLALDDPRTGAAAALELLDDALAAGDSAECLLDLQKRGMSRAGSRATTVCHRVYGRILGDQCQRGRHDASTRSRLVAAVSRTQDEPQSAVDIAHQGLRCAADPIGEIALVQGDERGDVHDGVAREPGDRGGKESVTRHCRQGSVGGHYRGQDGGQAAVVVGRGLNH